MLPINKSNHWKDISFCLAFGNYIPLEAVFKDYCSYDRVDFPRRGLDTSILRIAFVLSKNEKLGIGDERFSRYLLWKVFFKIDIII